MGRLRDGTDAPLWKSINEEVIDLFGNEDGILHRLDMDASCATKDPLWNEPTDTASYAQYKIPFLIQDWTTPIEVDDTGAEHMWESTIYVSRAHLEKVGVPRDSGGDYIRPGDFIQCWFKGDRIYWYIIAVDRQGFVNDSDYWNQYSLVCRRSTKYTPEREA
jgi:hypothetical protein